MRVMDAKPKGAVATTLIFVYNGDATLASFVSHLFTKMVNPSAYPCSLCSITCGNFGMRRDWKDFLKTLPCTLVFYHRDEFLAAFPDLGHIALPAILCRQNRSMEPAEFISAAKINSIADIEDLKALILKELPEVVLCQELAHGHVALR